MTPPAPTPEEQAIQVDAEFWQLPLGTDQEWASDWLIDRMAEALSAAHARGREEVVDRLETYCADKRTDRDYCPCLIHNLVRALRRPPSPREEAK